MVKVTQEATKDFLDQLLTLLPMSEEALELDMEARCEQICSQSALQTAEGQYGISAAELGTISQQLSMYSDLLFEQYRQVNKKQLHKFEGEVEEVRFET